MLTLSKIKFKDNSSFLISSIEAVDVVVVSCERCCRNISQNIKFSKGIANALHEF